MLRIDFIQFICVLTLCLNSSISFSQTLFSNIYNHTDSHTGIELLYETDENYYAIGRAQALGMQAIGLTVSCHDKKTGKVCASNIYTIENEWIFTDGRTPVFQVDNGFLFGAGFSNVILKLKYDLDSKTVTLIDSIVNPLAGSYFLHDMILAGDTTIYHATVLQEGGINISSIIHKYPNGSAKHFYLNNETDINNTGGKFYKKDNGNFIIFGSQNSRVQQYKENIRIIEIDSIGNIIKDFKTPFSDQVWTVTDIAVLNEKEFIILVVGLDYDQIYKRTSYPHWVYRFNMDTQKVIWRKQYGNPTTYDVSSGAKMVKGHRDDEYLYTTTVAAEGVTLDSFMTKARIVKIKGDGSKVWHKDYSYYDGNQKRNYFVTMMPTSDGNYLIGRNASSNVFKAWLVKINEDGDIVPIDTTSSAIEWAHDDLSKQISIYPNPATDMIIINQAEISDVTYHIRDLHGTLLRTMHIKDSHHNVTWDIHDLVSGVYIIDMIKDGVSIGGKKVLVR